GRGAAAERRARDLCDALPGDDPRGRGADRRGARPLRERRAGVLAAPGGREGAARGARAGGRAARAGGERGAPAGSRAVIVDSLVFLGESLFGHAASADDLLAWMDELEVDVAVVAPL